MKRNFKLVIAYDGKELKGWQFQPNERTIQGDIENELLKLFQGQKITLIGSGRTDSGVHAYGQVANIVLDTDWNKNNIMNALNANLKNDIYIKNISEVDDDFHARFLATERTYKYYLTNEYYPVQRHYAWNVSYDIDYEILSQCASLVLKNKDFDFFCKANSEVENKKCNIFESCWEKNGSFYIYTVKANRFLHHMVRFLVGTMVEVSRGRVPINEFKKMLSNQETEFNIYCAPPMGLFLKKVKY